MQILTITLISFFIILVIVSYWIIKILQLKDTTKDIMYYLSIIKEGNMCVPIQTYLPNLDYIADKFYKIKFEKDSYCTVYFGKNEVFFRIYLRDVNYKTFTVKKYFWKLFLHFTKTVEF